MKISLLLALAFIVSCAQMTKKTEPKIEPVMVSDKDIQQCREYQQNVLDRAYSEVKGTKNGEIEFVKDTKLARGVLAGFDINRSLVKPKSVLVQNILKECDEKTIKEFDDKYKAIGKCSVMFSELNYFQSLAIALNKYPWPIDLKLEGKKVALDYVRYFSEGEFPLLNRLVALSVLDELSINNVVNKELHNDIKVLMQESRIYVEGLRLKLNKDPGLSCDSLNIIRDELSYSNIVSQKMKGFLSRI